MLGQPPLSGYNVLSGNETGMMRQWLVISMSLLYYPPNVPRHRSQAANATQGIPHSHQFRIPSRHNIRNRRRRAPRWYVVYKGLSDPGTGVFRYW